MELEFKLRPWELTVTWPDRGQRFITNFDPASSCEECVATLLKGLKDVVPADYALFLVKAGKEPIQMEDSNTLGSTLIAFNEVISNYFDFFLSLV